MPAYVREMYTPGTDDEDHVEVSDNKAVHASVCAYLTFARPICSLEA